APQETITPTMAVPGVTDAPKVIETVQSLQERGGIDLYTDSDHDGISDYDELHIYGSDPHNAHTAGDVLTDGERVARGLNVLTKSTDRVPVESPLTAGTQTSVIFEVTAIHTENAAATSSVATTSGPTIRPPMKTSTSTATTSLPVKPSPEKPLVFEGRGLPNS